ncbi:MAG TPA: hypothetical protein VEB21_05890 [Terriglobales bacterium]|nr:hypothetical protein [Terriglobales bacterium]
MVAPAFAAPAVSLGTADAVAGGSVQVPLRLSAAEGVHALSSDLIFDSATLRIGNPATSCAFANLPAGCLASIPTSLCSDRATRCLSDSDCGGRGRCNVVRLGAACMEPIGDSTWASCRLSVPAGAADQTSAITNICDITDQSGQTVRGASCAPGLVRIGGKSQRTRDRHRNRRAPAYGLDRERPRPHATRTPGRGDDDDRAPATPTATATATATPAR